MKEIATNIKTFDIGEGFFLEFQVTDDIGEIWVYHKDYGIKYMLFGANKEYFTDEFIESQIDDAKAYYTQEVIEKGEM